MDGYYKKINEKTEGGDNMNNGNQLRSPTNIGSIVLEDSSGELHINGYAIALESSNEPNIKNGEGTGSVKLEGNSARGLNSAALGSNNVIQADRAFTNGGGNVIRYDPNNPTSVNGYMGFASGQNNYVSGWAAATIGEQLEAKNGGQFVIGTANRNESYNIFEIGNGTVTFLSLASMSYSKPLWTEIVSNPVYYRQGTGGTYVKITENNTTETAYDNLLASDIYIVDPTMRHNAFEVMSNGTARAYGPIMSDNDLTYKSYVDPKTITISLAQIADFGSDAYTTAPYIRFAPTQEQATILANEDVQVIKLDLTALDPIAPAPYIWIKRNTKVTINGLTAYQFSCGGEQFWYENYTTDIAIKNIGNAALVYVPQLILSPVTQYGVADITLLNISVPNLYADLGRIPKYMHFISDGDDVCVRCLSSSSTEITSSNQAEQFQYILLGGMGTASGSLSESQLEPTWLYLSSNDKIKGRGLTGGMFNSDQFPIVSDVVTKI